MAIHRIAVLLLALASSPATGQVLTGRVTEGAGGPPVSAALLELLDADSSQVAAALSGADGGYRLSSPTPGPFTLRVRRLGYATRSFEPVDLAVPRRLDIDLAPRPVQLEGVVATAGAVCADGPGVGPDTQRLWELVVSALDVTRLLQSQERYRFEMHRYVRDLTPARTSILQEGVERLKETGAFTAMPIRTLERQGYVDADRDMNFSWYMPDPEVLVSNHFLRTHCFRVEDDSDPDRVGLRFDPTPDRTRRRPERSPQVYRELFENRIAEVRGVLWVDRRTGALRDLEYEYTGFRDPRLGRHAGGFAQFEQLRGGLWIVRQWLVRMPNLERRDEGFEVGSVREVGGYVVDAVDETSTSAMEGGVGGDVVGRIRRGTLDFDLEQALVRLSGSPWATRPDVEGRFAFRDMPPGPYVVAWTVPRLDSIGVRTDAAAVEISAGSTTALELSGPDFEGAIDQICRGMPATSDLGAIRVMAPTGSTVTLRSVGDAATPLQRQTNARDGVATFCSLPTEVPLEIRGGDDSAPAIRFTLDRFEIRAIPLQR